MLACAHRLRQACRAVRGHNKTLCRAPSFLSIAHNVTGNASDPRARLQNRPFSCERRAALFASKDRYLGKGDHSAQKDCSTTRTQHSVMSPSLFFKPPLFVQRQRWILDQLARHRCKNILEVGCADAPIIKALLSQPQWVAPSEEWRHAFVEKTGAKDHPLLMVPMLSPQRYTAIEIDAETLSLAAKHIEDVCGYELAKGDDVEPRWEDMRVQLIHGSLLHDYQEVTGRVDAVVACEVIEHLDEATLEKFASSMLGRYKPRLLIVTTPNYAFNASFGSTQSKNQYPDPTGRTDRIFRHHDHKFEWTPDEFSKWCNEVCARYPYTVEMSGIGIGMRKQSDKRVAPVEVRDEAERYASQHAIFRRTEESWPQQPDCPISASSRRTQTTTRGSRNLIEGGITTFDFPATHEVRRIDAKDAALELCSAMLYKGTLLSHSGGDAEDAAHHAEDEVCVYEASLYQLWLEDSLRRTCRGSLENFLPVERMFDAIEDVGITWIVREGDVYLHYSPES